MSSEIDPIFHYEPVLDDSILPPTLKPLQAGRKHWDKVMGIVNTLPTGMWMKFHYPGRCIPRSILPAIHRAARRAELQIATKRHGDLLFIQQTEETEETGVVEPAAACIVCGSAVAEVKTGARQVCAGKGRKPSLCQRIQRCADRYDLTVERAAEYVAALDLRRSLRRGRTEEK